MLPDEALRACKVLAGLPDGASFVVSACLLGVPCRYDGSAKHSDAACELAERLRAVSVCPEQAAGLPCPRPPAELQADGSVLLADGTDVTEAFCAGAQACLLQARASGARVAVLKAKSPSCGVRRVYDGSFSGRLVAGSGVFARALREEGVAIIDEAELAQAREHGLL